MRYLKTRLDLLEYVNTNLFNLFNLLFLNLLKITERVFLDARNNDQHYFQNIDPDVVLFGIGVMVYSYIAMIA